MWEISTFSPGPSLLADNQNSAMVMSLKEALTYIILRLRSLITTKSSQIIKIEFLTMMTLLEVRVDSTCHLSCTSPNLKLLPRKSRKRKRKSDHPSINKSVQRQLLAYHLKDQIQLAVVFKAISPWSLNKRLNMDVNNLKPFLVMTLVKWLSISLTFLKFKWLIKTKILWQEPTTYWTNSLQHSQTLNNNHSQLNNFSRWVQIRSSVSKSSRKSKKLSVKRKTIAKISTTWGKSTRRNWTSAKQSFKIRFLKSKKTKEVSLNNAPRQLSSKSKNLHNFTKWTLSNLKSCMKEKSNSLSKPMSRNMIHWECNLSSNPRWISLRKRFRHQAAISTL